VKKTDMGRTCSIYGDEGKSISADTVLVGKPDGRRPLGRCRHRWEDNIKIGLREGDEGKRLDRSGSG
jgi:hypothetical protein